MIHIIHDIPPQQLLNRLNNPDGSGCNPSNPQNAWSGFHDKQAVRNELKKIQFGLCAYCENSLDNEIGNHIEHILSKSAHSSLTFEYTNLMLSCFDDKHIPKGDSRQGALSCGHYKLSDDNPLFIKPTENNCEQFFEFGTDGQITPRAGLNSSDNDRAIHTIDILNLNCNRLVRERKDIYQEGIALIFTLQSNGVAIQKFLELEVMSINGKYFPYVNLRKQLKSWYYNLYLGTN